MTTTPMARPAAQQPESNVKETIEQILVAFILAFIFRCFIVEAFVIPTGSMATTLLGAHMDFRCPDCGWHWNVNYSGDGDGDDVAVPSRAAEIYNVRCPNCGFKLPRHLAADPENDAAQPVVQYGDRILVQKYVYLLEKPRRWDVVVFKSPDTSRSNAGDDVYTQNYIKRLIGTPGETIMVLDGDIYASSSTKPTEQLTPDDFVVQTKPYKAQEALWRVVYDNDYQPRGLPRTYALTDPGPYNPAPAARSEPAWRQPWTPMGAGWDLSQRRTFRFDGASGGSGRLVFDPTVAAEKHPLTDWLAYDVSHMVNLFTRRSRTNGDFFRDDAYDSLNDVSDVKLALNYRRASGEGPLRLTLTKQDHVFTAELTPTAICLLMTRPGEESPTKIAERAISASSASRRIEFTSVDYRVALRLDGEEVLATTPEQFKPDVAALLADFTARRGQNPATITMEAEAQQCELAHVSLWRDVYYLNRDWPMGQYYWAMPDNFPNGDRSGRLMRLGPDEYFTMGDNSMLSSDARCWMTPLHLRYEQLDAEAGRVPGRFLLGKAFFVYWPAGYAPVSSLPGFVPNFGEMRFIH